MTRLYHQKLILISFLSLVFWTTCLAEGTKQIAPNPSDWAKIQVMPNRTEFAWYDRFGVSGNPEYRLNIHISNIGEVIYYGFGDPLTEDNQVRSDVRYRIKDPNGNIVVGENLLPLSGNGHINNHNEAMQGPDVIAGPSGYPALSYVPVMTGDFFIEFDFPLTWNNFHKQCKFRYFDVTVATAANTPIDGRLWSKAWQMSCDDYGNPFWGKMFIYTTDGVVTSLRFNGIEPQVFSVACNEYGCLNTGNFLTDRQSRAGYFMIPQYKIFLNNPDSLAYPTGWLGQLVPPVNIVNNCDGTVVVWLNVTQPGKVEILFNINPLPGQQAEDVLLSANVVAGLNGIPWNGLNGLGIHVPYQTPLQAIVTYYNGLTNFPLYDCEESPNGFKIDLIRPTGEELKVFWDDTLVGGTRNLTGCQYTASAGCHTFTLGQIKTINTWWYAIAPQISPVTFSVVKTPQTIPLINGPSNVCPGTNQTYWINREINSTSYIWNYTGTGATITPVNDTTISIAFAFNMTAGNLTVRGTNVECGPGPMTTLPITHFPTPYITNNPLTIDQCNNTATSITLSSTVSGSTFSWTCTPSSPSVTGYAAGSGNVINQTLANSSYTTQYVIYNVTAAANGCFGPDTNFHINVFPTPDVTNNPLSQSQCSNTATNIGLTSHVAGTTFSWTCTPSSPNVAGYGPGSGLVINNTLTNNGYNIETVTYSITPRANGCNGTPVNYTVTVFPVPDVSNNPLSKSQCNNTATNITLTSHVSGSLFSWTCTPSSPSVTGYSTGSGSLINQTLNNSSFINQTVTYHITPQANGCNGPVYDFTVTVFPTPDLTTSPLSSNQCNNTATNITLSSHVSGANFSWTCTPSSPNVTGYTPGVGLTISQTLTNSGFGIETVTYHITPMANGCSGAPYNYTVTVYPTPDVSNNPLSKNQCNNTATNITLTSHVSGSLFSWTCTPSSTNVTGYSSGSGILINQTLVNSGNGDEYVIYHIIATANGCSGPVYDYMVNIHATPNVSNNPMAQSQCNNTSTNVLLTSDVSGTTYTWTCSPSSPFVSGYAPGSGSVINQTLANSSFFNTTVTYHITPQANGCAGPVYDYVVTVFPTPDVSNTPLNKTQCNSTPCNLILTSHVAGTTFTWTCTPSSGNVSGFSPGNGSFINQVLNNLGNNPETVTYHIIPSANGCAGPVYNYVITVNPTPCLSNNPTTQNQCNNSNTNITLISVVSGTLFTWTCTPSSPNISGYSNNFIHTNFINQTLTSFSDTIESVIYHITPYANGCAGPPKDYTVNVFATPDLSNTPLNHSQCNHTATNLNLTSNVSGTLFTWTCSASSASVSGYSNNATPTIFLNQTLHNTGYQPETVTYHILPTGNGCSGTVYDYTVTVFPTPDLSNNPLSQNQCNNTATNLTLTSHVSGSSFSWTCTPSSGNVTGYSSGSGSFMNQVLVNSGYGIERVIYHVTPMANGCPGPVTNYVVQVFPTPDLTTFPLSGVQCSNVTTGITLTSHVTGTNYSWTCTTAGATMSGYSPGTGTFINQTIVNPGYTVGIVTYHIIPNANGCPGPETDYLVTVNPLPATSFTLCNDPVTTVNSAPITLRGGIPLGGIFSGPGVANNVFTPWVAGAGNHIITYTYTNTYSCSKSATQIITVQPVAPFTCGGNLVDVRDGKTYPTVLIGSQCWMAANLNYGTMIPGTQAQRDNCIVEKYCYNNTVSGCAGGALYQWDEMMYYETAAGAHGLCPPGWHVPTMAEWNTLFGQFPPGIALAGAGLKSTGNSGFDALVSGWGSFNKTWNHSGFATIMWSSTSYGASKAWSHGMNTPDAGVSTYPGFRSNAFAVRCIR